MKVFDNLEAYAAEVGNEIGVSEWMVIDQDRINKFAEATGDHQWIHLDGERTQRELGMPTIAHGFLILSLLPKMPNEKSLIGDISGYSFMMNYGSDRLRFSGAVTVGSTIHSRSRIKAIEVTEKNTRITLEQHVHVVGEERPALIYELTMVLM